MMITPRSLVDNPHYENVQDISPEEVMECGKECCIIDVRRDDEFTGELGHIETARHILLDEIPDRMGEIPKDKTLIMVCRSGQRSARATAFLKSEGYSSVYNMAGGMLAWNDLNYPIFRNP